MPLPKQQADDNAGSRTESAKLSSRHFPSPADSDVVLYPAPPPPPLELEFFYYNSYSAPRKLGKEEVVLL